MSKQKSRRKSPEAVENNIISLAMDLAEKRIKDGTASSQIVTHFVRRGSRKEKLEEELISQKKDLMAKKMELMESQQKVEALFKDALDAMKVYSGSD